jgi:hypothetical protein
VEGAVIFSISGLVAHAMNFQALSFFAYISGMERPQAQLVVPWPVADGGTEA